MCIRDRIKGSSDPLRVRAEPDLAFPRERGFALLIVLWTVVLLTLLVTQLTSAGRGEAQAAPTGARMNSFLSHGATFPCYAVRGE